MDNQQKRSIDLSREEGIFIIRLNRPEKLNAFNRTLYRQLNEALTEFNNDPNSRVAIVTGSGRAFSAGVDVKDLKQTVDERLNDDIDAIASAFSIEVEDAEFNEKPIIAAINGLCYGEGLSLAAACDLRIATRESTFCMPEVKIGLASIHGTLRLVKNLGLGSALEMLMMGDPVDAEWAFRTGLVNKVVEPDELLATAMEWARAIAALDPHAVRGTRLVAVKSQFIDFNETVDLGLRLRNGTQYTGGEDYS